MKEIEQKQYARAAVTAIKMLVGKVGDGFTVTPEDEWEKAIRQETNSESTIAKGCPRQTFLGLVDNGYIKGIPSGLCPPKRKGKHVLRKRAIQAADYVMDNPSATVKDLQEFLRYRDRQGSYDIVIALKDYFVKK